jgi:hypothetical protein
MTSIWYTNTTAKCIEQYGPVGCAIGLLLVLGIMLVIVFVISFIYDKLRKENSKGEKRLRNENNQEDKDIPNR